MSDLNSQRNRVVWFDLPVRDSDPACRFHEVLLGLTVHCEAFGQIHFGVLAHGQGNGGCLVPGTPASDPETGLLVYLNAEGRLREALAQAVLCGGRVLEAIRSIGPHGYRAIVLDSEGNRIALHSQVDR